MLKVIDLHKTYDSGENAYEALRGINLEINKGESVAIVGKSGSGKSTLLHLLAALDRPSSGEIDLNGENLSKLKEGKRADLRNKNFGFVFQQFFLQPNNTVLDNVVLPLKIAKSSKSKRTELAMKILSEVGLLAKANKLAKTLSGGEKQRTAIARALITSPEVIFADEPTGNLDTENSGAVLKLMFDLKKKLGNTLVIVTHDQDVAKRCDRTIYIKDGLIDA